MLNHNNLGHKRSANGNQMPKSYGCNLEKKTLFRLWHILSHALRLHGALTQGIDTQPIDKSRLLASAKGRKRALGRS